jgi:hypothetical protein
MKKERFYYGEELTISNLEVLVDRGKNIVGAGSLSGRKGFPRVSICGIYDNEENTMSFGVTRCSGNDVFIKSVGRELSRKRALETPFKVVKIHPSQKISDVFSDNAREIEATVMGMEYPIKVV